MGGHPEHVRSRVGRRGRHPALRRHGVAVRARRRVRAVPDLRQRTVALRAAPRSHRSRLPSHVRGPHARSKDAVTQHDRHGTGGSRDVLEHRIDAGIHVLPRCHDVSTTAGTRLLWRVARTESLDRKPPSFALDSAPFPSRFRDGRTEPSHHDRFGYLWIEGAGGRPGGWRPVYLNRINSQWLGAPVSKRRTAPRSTSGTPASTTTSSPAPHERKSPGRPSPYVADKVSSPSSPDK